MSSAWCVVTVPTEAEERQLFKKHARTPSHSTVSCSSSSSSVGTGLRLDAERCHRHRQRPHPRQQVKLPAEKQPPQPPQPTTIASSSSRSVGGGGGGGGGGYKSCPERQFGGTERHGTEPLCLSIDSDSPTERQRQTDTKKRSWEGDLRGLIDVGAYLNMRQRHRQVRRRQTSVCRKSLECVLRDILRRLAIVNIFWCKDLDGRMLQARFDINLDKKYERLITKLHECGIGERTGTSITVMNCLDAKSCMYPYQVRGHGVESAWDRFMDSVRCRLNVNHVVRQVRQDATITFDFLVLLAAAAVLACFGLVENSHLFLSSSMLISPLMGPIIAGVFGTVIRDNKLCWLGIKNELFGITCVTFIGLMFGIVVCFVGNFFLISEGLTQEILSRCETHALSVGFFTALASGAAGAIGVLGGNTGSLVGVAISASLLPPAVNSGMLWALALGTLFFDEDNQMLRNLVKQHAYADHQSLELIIYASISMGLTLLNIICVWLMGVIVLRVKEIAPSIRATNEKFWKHDIRIARQSGYDSETQNAIDEYADQNKEDFLIGMTEQQHQHTWSPDSRSPEYESICRRRNYHTIHGFEKLCMTLHQNKHKSVNMTEYDTATPSITVMDLFAKGPINISQSTSFDNLPMEHSKTDAAAEPMTMTHAPLNSRPHVERDQNRSKRRANFKTTASSSLSMLNERKYQRKRSSDLKTAMARVRSLNNISNANTAQSTLGDLAWIMRSQPIAQSVPVFACDLKTKPIEPRDATVTASSVGACDASKWPTIRLKRDDAEGGNSSSEECDV